MTDKERLYDIKHNSMWGVGYRTVTKEHFNWLIEQAERVQELEEIKNDAIEQIDVTHRRNKRLEERMLYLEEREKEIININQHEMQYRAELETRNVDLEHQNKRYREAFNKSREIWDKSYENYKGNKVEYLDGMLYGAKFIIDIFEKALEESE